MIRQVALNTIINSFDESSYVDLIVDGKTMEQVHWLGDRAYIDVWHRLRNRPGVTKSGRFVRELKHVNNFDDYGEIHYTNLEQIHLEDFPEGAWDNSEIGRNFSYVHSLYLAIAKDSFLKEHGFRPLRQWKVTEVDGVTIVEASRTPFREFLDKVWFKIRPNF
jgi:hypothetical protein